jgi:hypothetical protein
MENPFKNEVKVLSSSESEYSVGEQEQAFNRGARFPDEYA